MRAVPAAAGPSAGQDVPWPHGRQVASEVAEGWRHGRLRWSLRVGWVLAEPVLAARDFP